jgi:hypothetical protein
MRILFLLLLLALAAPALATDLDESFGGRSLVSEILLQPYSVSPGSVTTVATPTAVNVALTGLPSAGVCELYVFNDGAANVQVSINGSTPTTTARAIQVRPGMWALLLSNTPITSVKVHATSGSNSCEIGW